jgi:hypothetical protein
MKKHTPPTPAIRLADRLSQALHAVRNGPVDGRHRTIISGVTPKGTFVGGMTVDAFFPRFSKALLDTARFYALGNTTVLDDLGPPETRLATLAVQGQALPHAASVVAGYVAIGIEGDDDVTQSLVPATLVAAALAGEDFRRRLPVIKHYSRRPCLDPDFVPCRAGWNASSQILMHADEIAPAHFDTDPAAGPIGLVPPRLRAVLREFSWRSAADLANYLALLLTGLLINHFVDHPHPVGILDANQSGAGKTLLVQVAGAILDGVEPARIPLGKEEELEKRLCAQLLASTSTIFFLDNVRGRVESALLEQYVLSPVLTFRILGRSQTVQRANTFQWFLTSNQTSGTTDFIRRGVPVRLHVEGDPNRRRFTGHPEIDAARHRGDILAELMGMVARWDAAGRPPSRKKHRCARWAEVGGGILEANGLGEFFLVNVAEAEAEMDRGQLELATLAEHVVGRGPSDFWSAADAPGSPGKTAASWVEQAAAARVIVDRLEDATARSRATAMGKFLTAKIDCPVEIDTPDGSRRATLRLRAGTSRAKPYAFDVEELPEAVVAPAAEAEHGRSAPTPGGPATPSVPATGPTSSGDLSWT